jgi:tRNA dimethylallyltransferase
MIDIEKTIVILGPTASGKTKLAIDLAIKINGEIISADSRQVYQGMDIGTGKDLSDYLPLGGTPLDGTPFFSKNTNYSSGIDRLHLIDIVEAGENYNVAFFQRDFQKAYNEIISRNRTPILCGGTGMYIEAVLRHYENTQTPVNQTLRDNLEQKTDEQLLALFQEKHKNIHPDADVSTRKRLIRAIEVGEFKVRDTSGWRSAYEVQDTRYERATFSIRDSGHENENLEIKKNYSPLVFGINIPVEVRRERITKRLHERLQNGMIEEVKSLLENGIPAEKLIFYGLEYKFITEYLIGNLPYNEMAKRLEIAIHQFAKRQMTFFRSMERKDLKINWLDGLKPFEELSEQILNFIKNTRNDV